MTLDWKLHDLGPEHCIATWDTAHVYLINGNFTPAMLRALATSMQDFIADNEHRPSLCTVSIIARGAPPPPDGLRQKLADLYRGLPPQVKQMIVVPEGGGFRTAMVRGVCLALTAISPRSFRFVFASSVREAGNAMAPYLSRPSMVHGFEDVVEEMRTKLSVQPTMAVAAEPM